MITQGELRNQIEYDPETGLWRWRDSTARVNRKVGWFAGAKIPNGYLTIRIDGKTYYAHKLAWLWVHGVWLTPDHKNRNKADNRLDNLRPANKSENAINSKTRSDNSSGYPGVSLHSNGRWHAYVNKDGKRHNAYFASRDGAVEWASAKRKELFGEFAPEVVTLDSKRRVSSSGQT